MKLNEWGFRPPLFKGKLYGRNLWLQHSVSATVGANPTDTLNRIEFLRNSLESPCLADPSVSMVSAQCFFLANL